MIRMRFKDLDMERFQNVLELVEMIWATFFCWNSEKTRTTGGTSLENSNRELVSRCFLMVYHEVLHEHLFHIFPTMPVFECRFPVTYQADQNNCCTCIISKRHAGAVCVS